MGNLGEELSSIDVDVICAALNHYKLNIENYTGYPSYEFKQQQLERVESALNKIKGLKVLSKSRDKFA